MRTLYLIRHGQPKVREGHNCGYAQDVPLSEAGLHQGAELGEWAREKPITAVFTSPALRCVQTARMLAEDRLPVHTDSRLAEVDTGLWTGLTFEEIKQRWPAEYARRGQSMGTCPPPGGESFVQAGERMAGAVRDILARSEGDIAVVAHGGINRGWLCRLLDRSPSQVLALPQPWGGVTELSFDGDSFSVLRLGVRPCPYPTEEEAAELWEKYAIPAPVLAHCRAVARRALELADMVDRPVDKKLLCFACLLHDLVRSRPGHARACGEIMVKEGWPALADVIALHHDLPEGAGVEASLLYLADKLVQEDRPVSLEERFGARRALCGTQEALEAWERRYRRARSVMEELGLSREEEKICQSWQG